MKKTFWIMIAIALLITACKSEPLQTEDFIVTPVPTQQPLANRPEVTDGITAILREELAWTLEDNAYVATELDDGTVNDILALYLVSSGVFETAEVKLDSGETLQFDLVYTYQINHARQVVVVPYAIGMATADGAYTYFSDPYVADLVANRSKGITRTEALNEAKASLLPGKVFVIGISHLTDHRKVDWSHCPDDYYARLDGQYCKAAQQIDYGNLNLVVQRAATKLPEDWFLIGWFFNTSPDFETIDL